MTNKNYYIVAIGTLTLLTTFLHFATMGEFSPYVVLEELYYIPLILGVLRFGRRGAIITWLLVSTAYLPFFSPPWTTIFPEYVDRILHLVFSALIAAVVGFFFERERRNRAQAERERYLAGIGRVATVIVHDLKNPLVSILGFARRISEGKGDSALAAQTITKSAETMQKIVNNVLEFAKPMQLDIRDCDIGKTVLHAVETCRTKAAEREVALTTFVPENPVTIVLDSFHAERALVNLIDNAIDASASGGQVIVTSSADSQGMFITVKDHGTGMDSETMEHLFEPFYTTKSGGTGLGMPIAKKIFEEHGGTLVVTSTRDSGTIATVWLPINIKSEARKT